MLVAKIYIYVLKIYRVRVARMCLCSYRRRAHTVSVSLSLTPSLDHHHHRLSSLSSWGLTPFNPSLPSCSVSGCSVCFSPCFNSKLFCLLLQSLVPFMFYFLAVSFLLYRRFSATSLLVVPRPAPTLVFEGV